MVERKAPPGCVFNPSQALPLLRGVLHGGAREAHTLKLRLQQTARLGHRQRRHALIALIHGDDERRSPVLHSLERENVEEDARGLLALGGELGAVEDSDEYRCTRRLLQKLRTQPAAPGNLNELYWLGCRVAMKGKRGRGGGCRSDGGSDAPVAEAEVE